MKQVSQLVNNLPTMSIVQPVNDSGEDVAGFVNGVFKQLKSIFPAWGNAWKTDDELDTAKKVWVRSFIENGITSKRQVSLGLKNCRSLKTDFVPSVGKFIDLCRPTPNNLGLPEAEQAFMQASMNPQGNHHPVIIATIRAVDSYALKIGKVTPKQFEYTYMIMVNRYANGETLTKEVPKAITNGELKGLDAVLQQSENEAKRRVQLQGISTNAAEARRQALAVLGLKDRTKEARA